MDAQSYWFSSGAAGGGGDPGVPIGNSLRFRGGQRLTRVMPQNWNANCTISFWLKRATFGTVQTVFVLDTGQNGIPLRYATNDTITVVRQDGAAGTQPPGVWRDPSAWYHFCITNNNYWINGQLISTGTFISGSQSQDDCNIGCYGANNIQFFDGYMADINYVDGLHLNAECFGRFNDEGVWVPIDPVDTLGNPLDAADYGRCGFRLQFQNTTNIGQDTAPVGATGHTAANNFTNIGFNFDPVGIFSNGLTSATGFQAQLPAVNAFDGNTNTQAGTNGAGATLVFAPDPPIQNVSEVAIFSQMQAGGTLEWNGNTVNTVRNLWTTVAADPNNPATTATLGPNNTMELTSTAQSTCTLVQVRINGNTILTDNLGVNFDSMEDSPTQNYSLYNPLGYNSGSLPSAITPTQANLGYTMSSNPDIGFTFFTLPTEGRYYFEVTPTNTQEFGMRLYAPSSDNTSANGVGAEADILNQGTRWITQGNNPLMPTGQVAKTGPARTQIVIDADNQLIYLGDGTANNWLRNAGPGTYTIGAFNTANPSIDYSGLNADARANVQLAIYGDTASSINFGQRPFIMPIPNGWDTDTVLQSQQIPASNILNGSDHFRALTGTGANILGIAQGTNTNGTNWNPNINTGFTNGLWLIKDFTANSTQFQFVDSVRGAAADIKVCPSLVNTNPYQAPANNSVAWCWNAPDEMDQATRESGTVDVTAGRVNQTAGFSVLEYEGNTTNGATVAHGLSQPPEFLIAIAQDNTNSIISWVVGEGTILLNGSGPSGGTQITGTNNQFVTLSANTSVNGDTCSMYCWHSVPGYSRMGFYDGNSSANGPFIYTGFRPALVIIKSTANGGNWQIYDSTRNTTNATEDFLSFDNSLAQTTGFDIDLLANGFKIRASNGPNNTTNDVFYAAWAQFPFGGEDTAPANAR